jgi:acid phosphatase type 7
VLGTCYCRSGIVKPVYRLRIADEPDKGKQACFIRVAWLQSTHHQFTIPSSMECINCKAPNPDGKKFCGDCGNRLEGNLTSLVESVVAEKLDAAFKKKLEEYKQTEFEVTERVATRLIGWGKAGIAILGIPIVILSAFGIKGVLDINSGKAEIQRLVTTTKTDIQNLDQNVGPLTEKYKKLDADLGPAQQTMEKVNALSAQQRTLEAELRDQGEQLTKVQVKLAKFQPVPHPRGSLHLGLEKVIGETAVQKITNSGSLTFQTVGATGGVRDSSFQYAVAEQLKDQFKSGDAHNPAFLYLLGNIVFYNGEIKDYHSQFYAPYRLYPAPIFAVPGNHDGDPASPDQRSLEGFLENFCAKAPVRRPEAGDNTRTAMTQPNVYWTLDTPFATLIGLYTNVPIGGVVDAEQTDWFKGELKAAPQDKAVIVMMNQPAFSMDASHSGSPSMSELLDEATRYAGRAPDAVFSADVFNYQRFTRTINGRESIYIVAGVGGYPNLRRMPDVKLPVHPDGSDWSLESYYVLHGFVQVTVSRKQLLIRYYAVTKTDSVGDAELRDSATLDLESHRIVSRDRP